MPARAPRLVVIAGPNGAGKTTSAPELLQLHFGITQFVNADAIAQGLSAFAPESVAVAASRIMIDRLDALGEAREDFAFEVTLASQVLARRIEGLQSRGYEFGLVFFALETPDLAVARVAQRVKAGGHSVPEADVRRRFQRGLANFFGLYRAMADQWFLWDNSARCGPRQVARGRRLERIEVFDEEVWKSLEARYAPRS